MDNMKKRIGIDETEIQEFANYITRYMPILLINSQAEILRDTLDFRGIVKLEKVMLSKFELFKNMKENKVRLLYDILDQKKQALNDFKNLTELTTERKAQAAEEEVVIRAERQKEDRVHFDVFYKKLGELKAQLHDSDERSSMRISAINATFQENIMSMMKPGKEKDKKDKKKDKKKDRSASKLSQVSKAKDKKDKKEKKDKDKSKKAEKEKLAVPSIK